MAVIISRDIVRDLGADAPHVQRLKQFSAGLAPRQDSFEGISARLMLAKTSENPDFQRAVKKAWRQAVATTLACAQNGAGLPADLALREFLTTYNDRLLRFGAHYLPLSFNILEAFLRSNDLRTVFRVRPEKNHILDFGDFLDHITRPGPSLVQSRLNEISEGVIYHYSFLNSGGQWTIGEIEKRFSFSSVSLIRFKNDLTIFAQAGFEANLAAVNEGMRDVVIKANAEKPGLAPAPTLVREAVALEGHQNAWRTFLAVRIDLFTYTLSSRYMLTDMGDSWEVVSDDPITTSRMPNGFETAAMNARLDARNGAFGVLANMALLPQLFEEHAGSRSDEVAYSGLRDVRAKRDGKFVAKYAFKDQLLYEHPVHVLTAISARRIDSVVLPEYSFSVEVNGYWKSLPFGQYGVDHDGRRVLGRTWVRQTDTSKSGTLLSESQAARNSRVGTLDHAGTIYVARNAAHQLDIFKIGLTRRTSSVRIKELSSATGVPDKFLVAQEWRVSNVSLAEKRIHELLSEYRLSESREFFRVPYAKIREIVEVVIAELGDGD